MEYRKVFIVDAMGELQEKILNSKKKAQKKVEGHVTYDPLPRFCRSCIVIYHMKLAFV